MLLKTSSFARRVRAHCCRLPERDQSSYKLSSHCTVANRIGIPNAMGYPHYHEHTGNQPISQSGISISTQMALG